MAMKLRRSTAIATTTRTARARRTSRSSGPQLSRNGSKGKAKTTMTTSSQAVFSHCRRRPGRASLVRTHNSTANTAQISQFNKYTASSQPSCRARYSVSITGTTSTAATSTGTSSRRCQTTPRGVSRSSLVAATALTTIPKSPPLVNKPANQLYNRIPAQLSDQTRCRMR